jgi:hypothetical protein
MHIIGFLKVFGVVIFPALFILLLYLWDRDNFMRRWRAFWRNED